MPEKAFSVCIKDSVFIDPPYNTGNDSFIYPDKFSETREEYARRVSDTDENGYLKRDGVFQGAFRKNAKDNGHYHSNWLNMILPCLHLAKTLLSDDGVIFISIDDNEQAQLKLLCDEVFGEENFVNQVAVKMSELSGVKMKHLNQYAKLKEFMLIYAKNIHCVNFNIEKKRKSPETLSKYLKYYSSIIENIESECEQWKITPLSEYLKNKNIVLDEDKLNEWKLSNVHCLVYRTNSRTIDKYLLENPNASDICKLINDDGKEVIKWGNKEMLFLEKYIDEYLGDIWLDISTINLNKETRSLVFENGQKPLMLLKRLLKTLEIKDNIVMDFFAGSGTTAHAVMQLNAEDNGNRRFICVQLPKETDEKSEAAKAGFATIAEIAKERIRRAGAKIKAENPNQNIDTGFKVFKLAQSHFKQWKTHLTSKEIATPATQARNDGLNSGSLKQSDWLENALQQHTDTLLSNNTENIFYELLFRFGLRPTAEIIQDNGVFCVKDKGFVFVIQAENADEAFFENILQTYQPMKIVVVEKIFNGKDDFKKNTALQIKDAGVMFVCV